MAGFSVKCSEMVPPHALSDVELTAAVAIEVFHWRNVSVDASGSVTGSLSRGLTPVPARAPHWASNDQAAVFLEDIMRRRGLWHTYTGKLVEIADGDVGAATARQRAEAALAAVRSRN